MGQDARIQVLRQNDTAQGGAILYWMQASLRTRYNHALEYAIHLANHRRCSLSVVFVLVPNYPGATTRHYNFLLECLVQVQENLNKRGISLTVERGNPPEIVARHGREASTIITDRGYTRVQREWRDALARNAPCQVIQVESNVVVPVEVASEKEEYSAATIRPKIHRHLDTYLQPFDQLDYWNAGSHPVLPITAELQSLAPTGDAASFSGGENTATEQLQDFLENRLDQYHLLRNVPNEDWTSRMSPYLHFGAISPVEIALRAISYSETAFPPEEQESLQTLLEELIVRRELAINFVVFNNSYDSYEALPAWARKTLGEHSGDERPRTYSLRQLENAETHDPYWNACQQQMVKSGMMHGYMRMYWGKKILEWTPEPQDAFAVALELNDRYELDGRDPNGYAGVAWCFGKHDRPWVERDVFGKVRYMNDRGLKRKFKQIDQYVTRWLE